MDIDIEEVNISEDSWNNFYEFYSECEIKYSVEISTGLRFRYLSEIDKKSYSLLKSENNSSPVLKIVTCENNVYIKIEPITQDNCTHHFYILYEVVRDEAPIFYEDNPCIIYISECGHHEITLDHLGIQKLKQKEAISRIKSLYPNYKDNEAKHFFDKQKDVIRLKATLYQYDIAMADVISGPIKCQNMKENKSIHIKHIAPKVIASSSEDIIIVLEKKITSTEIEAFISIKGSNNGPYKPVYSDQQTFVFAIPPFKCVDTTDAKFIMRCGMNQDEKPIKFLSIVIESKKRKIQEDSDDSPLKRLTTSTNDIHYDHVNRLLPESVNNNDIQTDNIHMETGTNEPVVQENYFFKCDNESYTDSVVQFGDRKSTQNKFTFGSKYSEASTSAHAYSP